MSESLKSLMASGTKLWLDSIDPELVASHRALGGTGATSNPVIVSALIRSGRFDSQLREFAASGATDSEIAWQTTDQLVQAAQDVFLPVWESTGGNDGYVSFEVDPLLEDPEAAIPHDDRVASYIELGKKWSAGRSNRMIKVPATAAGLDALEELAAAGITLNVTLIFTSRQYQAARDAVWRGAQRRENLTNFKSVYSIFVSRVDVYTEKHIPGLSSDAQGMVGIVNAKKIWKDNQQFWQSHNTPLEQEIIFASTGVKSADIDPWKYVAAFAGSDIQTNPPATNDAVATSGLSFSRQVDQLPDEKVLAEIESLVDEEKMETVLMEEGIQKFADPQKALLALIDDKRAALVG